jgi:hypothetical protein
MNTDQDSTVIWQRLEGLAALLLSICVYWQIGGTVLLFGVLFLAPDISILGYRRGTRAGAMLYNLFHNYAVPLALVILSCWNNNQMLMAVALIWVAHIGFDRMLGYGLKYPSSFQETHLGRIGKS